MSTPESSKEIGAVHTSGGIRKSLLTPFRRIGLPRNRKTPKNIAFKSPLQTNEPVLKLDAPSTPCGNGDLTHNLKEGTTILVSQERNKRRPRNLEYREEVNSIDDGVYASTVSVNHKKLNRNKKGNILENFVRTDTFGDLDDANINRNKEVEVKNAKVAVKDDIKINFKDNCNLTKIKKLDGVGTNINPVIPKENRGRSNKNKIDIRIQEINNDRDTINETSVNSEIKIADSQESSKSDDMVRNLKNTKRKKYVIDSDDESFSGFPSNSSLNESLATNKKIRNNISSQNSVNPDDFADKDTYNLIQNSPNTLENNSLTNQVETIHDSNSHGISKNIANTNKNTDNNKTTPKPKSNKSIRRKLSLKRTISNEDSFESDEIVTSTPLERENPPDYSDMDKEKLITEILKLEKTIQNKEDKVDKLKQASIYRKLHNIEDLKLETKVWKVGCQSALRELLMNLNKHTNIDMNTLVANLQVPEHLFSYDVENDYFID